MHLNMSLSFKVIPLKVCLYILYLLTKYEVFFRNLSKLHVFLKLTIPLHKKTI